MFAIAFKEVEHYLLMIFHEVLQGADRQMSVVVAELFECFLDAVGGLSHSRDDEHQVVTVFIFNDFLEVSYGIGIFHRGSTELIDSLYHDEILFFKITSQKYEIFLILKTLITINWPYNFSIINFVLKTNDGRLTVINDVFLEYPC